MTALINASTSSGVVVTSDTSGSLAIQNNGSTTMTVTGGAVGIGTTSPSATLHVYGTNSQYSRLESSTYSTWQQSFSGNGSVGVEYATGQPYRWVDTSAGERMRLNSSGNLLVGVTSSATGISFSGTATQTIQGSFCSTDGTNKVFLSGYDNATNLYAGIYFNTGAFRVYNASNTGVYLSSGGTSWTGTSDRNLKNITGKIENAVQAISTLTPARFTWKSDEENKPQVGLIAQEVQAVLPEVVDEMDNGHLGIRYSETIPLLVAAIQELKAELDATKAEVAALKGTV